MLSEDPLLGRSIETSEQRRTIDAKINGDAQTTAGPEGGGPVSTMKIEPKTAVLEYWSRQPASVDGVLGGYGHLHSLDIRGSKEFSNLVARRLRKWKVPFKQEWALDLGAGIGRVTQDLLLPMYRRVDLVEPVKELLETAEKTLGRRDQLHYIDRCIEDLDSAALGCDYDCIWLQWVAMYIEDDALVQILMKLALRCPNGFIGIKDNVNECTQFDDDDNSRARSINDWLSIFEKAELDVIHSTKQRQWPTHLYDVYMFALRPAKSPNLPRSPR